MDHVHIASTGRTKRQRRARSRSSWSSRGCARPPAAATSSFRPRFSAPPTTTPRHCFNFYACTVTSNHLPALRAVHRRVCARLKPKTRRCPPLNKLSCPLANQSANYLWFLLPYCIRVRVHVCPSSNYCYILWCLYNTYWPSSFLWLIMNSYGYLRWQLICSDFSYLRN